ncbi:MAG: thymidine phosphorylase family protein [Pyrinomonadaceae bacterium]|nr:thymidine phosphorylase family protein [Pyrinomonadaceae bacterium]
MKTIKRKQHSLKLKRLGVDSRNEHLVFMRRDCPVCKSEGFEALNRISVANKEREVVASLVVMDGFNGLDRHQVGLSEDATRILQAREGDSLTFSHLKTLESMSDVRRKIYGNPLDQAAYRRIVEDIVDLNLSNIQLSAFLTACAGDRLDLDEIICLTRSMIDTGQRLDWGAEAVFDKHCIGGLPGYRTTPIVVSIIAASGLRIPKTSSRAITSPAGTADMMETLTNVDLSVKQIEQIVDEEGGCLAWGGAVQLSPADDILIRVERALDIDSEGQMIASVLSKKAAAGATAVVIDIPVGPTAKVRSAKEAEELAFRMRQVGDSIDLLVEPLITDGSQPVGRGVGPALEAKDVLAVLKDKENAPADLRARAVTLAGKLLEMAKSANPGEGMNMASRLIESGEAWRKFKRICDAQGGLKTPPEAEFRREVLARETGKVVAIDNRRIARLAKLAGAPAAPSAGILLNVSVGDEIDEGGKLFELHAESEGEIAYAFEYLEENTSLIGIE